MANVMECRGSINHSRHHNSLNELKETSQEIVGSATKTKYLGLDSLSALQKLQRLKDTLPQSKLAALYRALIDSHPRYGNIVWGCIVDTKLQSWPKLVGTLARSHPLDKLHGIFSNSGESSRSRLPPPSPYTLLKLYLVVHCFNQWWLVTFFMGGANVQKLGVAQILFVSHTLNTVMTFSILEWRRRVGEGGILQSPFLLVI